MRFISRKLQRLYCCRIAIDSSPSIFPRILTAADIGFDAGGLFAAVDGRQHPGARLFAPHVAGAALWRINRHFGVRLQALAGPVLVGISAKRRLGDIVVTETAAPFKLLFGASLGLTILLGGR